MDSPADDAPAAVKLRRVQFSLRSLFLVMIVCGLLLGRYGIKRYEIAREQTALAELQAEGADAQFDNDRVVGISFSGAGPSLEAFSLLARLPRLERLVLIQTDLTDEGLARVAELDGLRQLLLLDADITDNGLAPLTGLGELRNLRLDHTDISDNGLRHIAQLNNLERLDLVGTRVTDDGLVHLTKLPQLRRLYLNDTAVTAEGVAWLEERLPEAKIAR